MTHILDGANTTAQWYQDSYPGASVFSRLDKFLLHTTETLGWPGYSGGASAPNATYHPKLRQIRQHFGANRSARALRDPSGTAVRENRDNVFQLEIICYSDRALSQRFGGLWVGDLTATHMRDIAAVILQLRRDWNLPVRSSVTWREGRATSFNDVRLSGPEYDAYRGILGHCHASGNSHWDPGGFYYSRLEAALSWQLANNPIFTGITFDPGETDIDIPEADMTPEESRQLAEIRSILRWRLEDDALQRELGRFFAAKALAYGDTTLSRDQVLENAAKFAGNATNDVKWRVLPELAAIRAAHDGEPVDEAALAQRLAVLLLPEVGEQIRAELASYDGVDEAAVAERVVAGIGAKLTAPTA